MKFNKRGGLSDIFLFMIFAFIIAVVCGLFLYIGTTTYVKLLEMAPNIQKILPNENATLIIQSTFGQVPNSYQALKWITVLLIGGMMLSILVTSFLVNTRPVFFVPYFLIVAIATVVSAPLSNAYEKIYLNPILAETFSGFWGQNYIFVHLPVWILVIGFLAGIIMFVNMMRTTREYGGYYQ